MKAEEFLMKALTAARAAGHLFPEYAVCEAALESGWGSSELAVRANNLFGQKQSHPAHGLSYAFPTREFLHGAWMTVRAEWIAFSGWQDCFAHRMAVLRELARGYPHYGAALAAKSGQAFILEVSKSWSTDPDRASKVLAVYRNHFAVDKAALRSA